MGGSHGIGIKRNDYRRRNRKENISMHSHKHGYNKQTEQISKHNLMPFEVEVVKLTQAELVKQAKAHWSDKPKARIEYICFTYVRHKLTNYDKIRKTLKKENVSSDRYLYIVQRICNAVAETYPQLARECDRYYKEKLGIHKFHGRKIRLIKQPNTLTQEQLEEYNAKEEEKWKGIIAALEQEEIANEDYEVNLTEALSSLASERLLYFPPFLKKDEIEKRRFGSGLNNNDRW